MIVFVVVVVIVVIVVVIVVIVASPDDVCFSQHQVISLFRAMACVSLAVCASVCVCVPYP